MQFGYIIDFVSASAMLRIFWQNVGLLCPTKLFGVGVTNLARRTLERLKSAEAYLETHGTWMRYISLRLGELR